VGVTLRARWVTLRARWLTLRARWVTLRARWVTLRARWVTLRARWATLRARWVTLRARWVTLRARWVTFRWAVDEWKSLDTLPPEAIPQHDGFQNQDEIIKTRVATGKPHGKPAFDGIDALYSRCLLVFTRTLGGDVRLCLVRTPPEQLIRISGLLRRMAGRRNDTVVINWGVRTLNPLPPGDCGLLGSFSWYRTGSVMLIAGFGPMCRQLRRRIRALPVQIRCITTLSIALTATLSDQSVCPLTKAGV
jgi:hypothetical protein